jgi:putative ABC transport system permease protein
MNLVTLVLKQMRQRWLSTVLTAVAVALGAALALGVLVVQREGESLVGQQAFGYDLVVGPRTGSLGLVLHNSYGIGPPTGTISWDVYEEATSGEWQALTRAALPMASGDTYAGLPVVSTTPGLFGLSDAGEELPEDKQFHFTADGPVTLAEGRPFHAKKFEAVVGSRAVGPSGLKVGDKFSLIHGSEDDPHAHAHGEEWTVVGIMAPTQTALDGQIVISLTSSFALGEHAAGMIEQTAARAGLDHDDDHAGHDHDGHDHAAHDNPAHGEPGHVCSGESEFYHMHGDMIHLDVPEEAWRVGAVLVDAADGAAAAQLQWRVNNSERAAAAVPGREMRQLFDGVLAGPGWVLFGVAVLVVAVAAVGVLVGIYNSVIARRGEIAVLRALGATRSKIMTLLTLEAALIGVAGVVLGWLGGKALAWLMSTLAQQRLGRGFDWWAVSWTEFAFAAGVIALAALAGLLPALSAYRVSVGRHL